MYAESSTPTVPCSVFVCRSISETDVALQPCQKELLHVMIHVRFKLNKVYTMSIKPLPSWPPSCSSAFSLFVRSFSFVLSLFLFMFIIFFFYSLCLCPLHFTMFLFLWLFRASWTFAFPPFSKTYKTSSSPKRDFQWFSCKIHTIHSINSTSSLSKIEKAEQSRPLHVGYRIRALYLREQDTCQLAPSSYVVVFFSPCTCFRVHLPSLLCYSIPCSFFLFVSCFFSSLSYSTSLSPLCPSLAKVNGQWHGGKMGTPACDADYTHYITSLPLSPHFNRCNFLLLSLFFFLLHFLFQLPPTCSCPLFYSLSLSSSLFLFVLALFIFLAHAPILSNVFLVLVFTRRNEITKRKHEDENGTHTQCGTGKWTLDMPRSSKIQRNMTSKLL